MNLPREARFVNFLTQYLLHGSAVTVIAAVQGVPMDWQTLPHLITIGGVLMIANHGGRFYGHRVSFAIRLWILERQLAAAFKTLDEFKPVKIPKGVMGRYFERLILRTTEERNCNMFGFMDPHGHFVMLELARGKGEGEESGPGASDRESHADSSV